MTWLFAGTLVFTLVAVWVAYSKGKRAGERAALAALVDKHETDQEIDERVRRMSADELDERVRKYQRP